MERIWLRNYPPGVAHDIDPSIYSSLVALLEESFAKYRDRDAFVFMGKRLSFAELDAKSRALGAWLQAQGLQRGARVALMMPNVLQYPIAIAAVLRAGYVVVNVNPLYTPRELEFQLKDSGAEALIVLENFAHVAEKALPDTQVKHVVVASMGDQLGLLKGAIVNLVVRRVKKMVPDYALPQANHFNDALNAGSTLGLTNAALGPEDVAFLQYTGGTTGVAKGAILTHRNMVANVLQVDEWHKPVMAHIEGQVVMVAALPLYHIFALTICYLYGMRCGGLGLLIPNPRDLPALIKDLAHYKVTCLPAVNTLFNGLLHHPEFGKVDWSSLRLAVGGGMAVQRAVADAWFKATGRPIVEGYGLSETSPVLTANRVDTTDWTGTIGMPMPSTDLSIRDDAGKELPLGERGEICARGPQVMAGYWQRPDETAMVMTKDGFFRTGDIGVMDEQGRFTIVDRKKDMISVSGFKVFPNEIEDVAMSQGGLLECACVGVPDAQTGEAVKLYCVKRSAKLTEHELEAFLRGKLTNYKVPKHIEFRQELPKTNVGKILRRALRDEAVAKANAA